VMLLALVAVVNWRLGLIFTASLFCMGTFLEVGMWIMAMLYLAVGELAARPVDICSLAVVRKGASSDQMGGVQTT
jgi:hypothetical protein